MWMGTYDIFVIGFTSMVHPSSDAFVVIIMGVTTPAATATSLESILERCIEVWTL